MSDTDGADAVLDRARALLASGPLCDHCLGRPFADRSFGLGNDERGRGLRTAVALADDTDFEPADPDDCWVCEGVFTRLDELVERATDAVASFEFATYQVGSRVPGLYEENDRLLREDAGLDPEDGEPLRKELNREVGKRVGRATETDVDFDRPDVQFLIDLEADTVEADVNSAFVYGRYRKLERDVPQTEWPCSDCRGSGYTGDGPCEVCDGSGYRYEESVEQLTAPVVEDVMDGVDTAFHGAGREDVDALMLGTGRPFVIEVEEPRRRDVDAERLEGDVNAFADGTVEVDGLRLATYETVERVKELDASKRYRAQVQFGEAVAPDELAAATAELSGTTVEQYTPERVDHRRASLTRERTAYEVTGERDPEDPTRATVEIHGEGGLYVKELVSGDGGRTEPSLAGLLGVDAEVTALDVVAVRGESEPFERESFFLDDRDTTPPAETEAAEIEGAQNTDVDADDTATDEAE
ncbi:tRNA pseudouridine(54/55) synthase Pus10 [Halobaculum sp. MBLA0147]|uniref:tRNA pseudouridine(54/55) synthase Pus10 n=1 Tax=Halobaculum sp. MBLA0147 TaxID=3079934 RepID=UPI003524908D